MITAPALCAAISPDWPSDAVFSGGIGKSSAPIHSRTQEGLDFFGLALNDAANDVSDTRIGAGKTEVLVICTDEKRVIAIARAAAAMTD